MKNEYFSSGVNLQKIQRFAINLFASDCYKFVI